MASPLVMIGDIGINYTNHCQAPAWGHSPCGQGGISGGTLANMSNSIGPCPCPVSANTVAQPGAFGSTGATPGIADNTDPGPGRLTDGGSAVNMNLSGSDSESVMRASFSDVASPVKAQVCYCDSEGKVIDVRSVFVDSDLINPVEANRVVMTPAQFDPKSANAAGVFGVKVNNAPVPRKMNGFNGQFSGEYCVANVFGPCSCVSVSDNNVALGSVPVSTVNFVPVDKLRVLCSKCEKRNLTICHPCDCLCVADSRVNSQCTGSKPCVGSEGGVLRTVCRCVCIADNFSVNDASVNMSSGCSLTGAAPVDWARERDDHSAVVVDDGLRLASVSHASVNMSSGCSPTGTTSVDWMLGGHSLTPDGARLACKSRVPISMSSGCSLTGVTSGCLIRCSDDHVCAVTSDGAGLTCKSHVLANMLPVCSLTGVTTVGSGFANSACFSNGLTNGGSDHYSLMGGYPAQVSAVTRVTSIGASGVGSCISCGDCGSSGIRRQPHSLMGGNPEPVQAVSSVGYSPSVSGYNVVKPVVTCVTSDVSCVPGVMVNPSASGAGVSGVNSEIVGGNSSYSPIGGVPAKLPGVMSDSSVVGPGVPRPPGYNAVNECDNSSGYSSCDAFADHRSDQCSTYVNNSGSYPGFSGDFSNAPGNLAKSMLYPKVPPGFPVNLPPPCSQDTTEQKVSVNERCEVNRIGTQLTADSELNDCNKIDVLLPKYDGSTPLSEFLVQLQRCTEANKWSDSELLIRLIMCLRGPAILALGDGSECSTSSKVIVLLRKRFGTKDSDEVFRAQLRRLRRGTDRSATDMFAEIHRLMPLAFDEPTSPIAEAFAIDVFLNSLSDPELEHKVRQRFPVRLEDA